MLALRALARLVELLLMAALALVGLGVGLYCLSGLISLGSARPDRLLHLPEVRHRIGHYLLLLATPGPLGLLALLGGIAAILIGLVLLVGLLGSRRERLLVLSDDPAGGLYVRPRAVSRMVREQTERASGVTGVGRPKVRLARDGRRGKVKVRATRGPDPDAATVDSAAHELVDPITESLHLRGDVRVRLSEPKAAHEFKQRDMREARDEEPA